MGTESGDAKKKLLELDEPGSPSSARGLDAPKMREPMATITDEFALEQARLQSLPSNVPPARATIPADRIDRARDSSGETAEIDVGETEIEEIEVEEDEEVTEVIAPGEEMYRLRARLAPLSRVPELAQPLTELGAVLADPKTAYVLGFVDGILPLDTIIDVTGLPELDTLRVLGRMVANGVIVFRTPSMA